ncbi:MAG: large repetitive protein [Frankiales bacterium]|nr:large repetitive protein [Frankiales bacterium]
MRSKTAALAASASLVMASLVSLVATLPTTEAAAAAAAPGLATVHPVSPISVADTAVGRGAPKRALTNGRSITIAIGGTHGIPSSATSVMLAVLVTRATGTGQVRVGAGRSTATAAVAANRGQQTTSAFTSRLAVNGTLYVTYAGTGAVQVRLVLEAYTAGDLTGSSFHPLAPVRVADTRAGRGLPAHLLARHAAAQVQIAGADGIPRTATAVLLTVNINSSSTAGAITAGLSARATAPVVTFGRGRQVTGSVLAPLSHGKVTLVNSSSGAVGLTANAVGYYTADTTGLLFQAVDPVRIVDTRAGLGSPKRPLSTTALTVGVRAAAHLPASAAAAALSFVVPAQGLSAVSTGATTSSMSTVLLTNRRQAADSATVVPLNKSGAIELRANGQPVQALVAVVGFFAKAPIKTGPSTPPPTTPPTSGPPTSRPPTSTPPTTTPPTTTPPGKQHPSVSSVDPADNAMSVDPSTTSVVCDLMLPNRGVKAGSLNATTVTLVPDGLPQVPANYGTSGGADTINVSPIGALLPNTWYTFTVTAGVTDVDGISFVPFSSRFKTGPVLTPDNNIAFDKYASGASGHSFASLTKGPDGKLYASTLDGWIYRYTIGADGTLSNEQAIDTVRQHAVAAGLYGAPTRTIIGLAFDPDSTAGNLILWITDNSAYTGTTDPLNYIPDSSDHLAKLTGPNLQTYTDVLSGLPRSVKDHETNSIAFDANKALYLSQGANNAMGQKDTTWGNRDEHLLNAAVLRLDVTKLPSTLPLDVQTYDAGGTYDPYAPNAPLTLYATGLRNAFDLVWHSNGHLYAPTNGSAAFGSAPGTPATMPVAACAHRTDGGYSGPAVPAESFIPTAETDFVFDVKPGRYYGHPDPARCEYVLDNGNPTAGVDPFEVAAYPAGTFADPNYDLADVYDAGLHASADGAIEYHGSAFNGSLDHRLLVVRYSNGQDIETFDVAHSGQLSNRTVGIKGFTGFQSPLDVTEDNATGNLYVSELGTYPGNIELLRPRGLNPAALLTVTNNATIPANDRMILSRIQTPDTSVPGSVQAMRDGGTLLLTAAGGAPVTVSSLPVTGPFRVDNPPALPYVIPPGGHLSLIVRFTATSGRVSTGSLTIQTNASGQGTRTIALAGFFQSQSATAEPTPRELAAMMGWSTNVPANLNDAGHVQADGDEILATSFARLDPTQPVTVRQIAEYSTFPTASTLSYYDPNTPATTTAVLTSKDIWAQSVLPATPTSGLPATGSFLPPTDRFGLKVDTEFSDDSLNSATADQAHGCVSQCGHHLRFFPVKDGTGGFVPGSYYVVVDLSGAAENYDYNDAAYLVTNLQP